MLGRMRSALLRLLRVPPEPAIPVNARVIRVFRAAPAFYRYRLVLWGLGQLGALAGLVGGLVFITTAIHEAESSWIAVGLRLAEVGAWAAFVVQGAFSLAVVHLDFEMRWYILSDRSLRIREGVLSVREKTMTFANIQQISIRQNPLQRLLGIADVEVRNAGGGGGAAGAQGGGAPIRETAHVAYFRGVDNAEEIRAAVLDRIRQHRDAGLGDPDEPLPLPADDASAPLAAARELLDEVRLLGRALRERRAG